MKETKGLQQSLFEEMFSRGFQSIVPPAFKVNILFLFMMLNHLIFNWNI